MVEIPRFWSLLIAKNDPPVHMVGYRATCRGNHCRGQIEELDEIGPQRVRLDVAGPAHD